MIRLTRDDGKFVYIHPEQIFKVDPKTDGSGSWINDVHEVKEQPEEVVRRIVEYRLAMIDYTQGDDTEIVTARKKLMQLAGLEAGAEDGVINLRSILRRLIEWYDDGVSTYEPHCPPELAKLWQEARDAVFGTKGVAGE